MTTINNNMDETTKNYLQFCYTCEDAHLCTTEEKCKSCWAEQAMTETTELNETQNYLQMMHA
ncbi:hypothetical protein [Paenibacillus sp. CMAA1364]